MAKAKKKQSQSSKQATLSSYGPREEEGGDGGTIVDLTPDSKGKTKNKDTEGSEDKEEYEYSNGSLTAAELKELKKKQDIDVLNNSFQHSADFNFSFFDPNNRRFSSNEKLKKFNIMELSWQEICIRGRTLRVSQE